jgi:hypothetical protein
MVFKKSFIYSKVFYLFIYIILFIYYFIFILLLFFFLISEFARQAGVDWGHDRSWCNAARMYSTEVLNRDQNYDPCGIIIDTPPVHHLNTRLV